MSSPLIRADSIDRGLSRRGNARRGVPTKPGVPDAGCIAGGVVDCLETPNLLDVLENLEIIVKSVILVGEFNPATDTYLVDAAVPFSGITGIRLEALADGSLPWEGPGRQPLNGNFVLTEFSVQAIPEPGIVGLLLLGLGAMGVICRKTR